MMPTPSTNPSPSASPRSIRLRRVIKGIVFGGIALAVVMLIPAAPGQSGGGGGAGGPSALPSASSTPATPLPWRPFIDPIDIHSHWYLLLIPMALGISMVYKAVRLQTLDRYWFQVVNMTVQIVVAMIMLAAASAFVVLKFAPFILSR